MAFAATGFLYEAVARPWRHLHAFDADFSFYHAAATALTGGVSPYIVYDFGYPPLTPFLLAPLALLSYEGARELWLVVGQLCLLAAAWLTWRAAGKGRGALLVVAGAWGLAGTLAANLVMGQLHPLLLLLLAGALATLASRPGLSGALVALAAAIKLWPALLLVALAVAGQWRAFIAGVTVCGLLLLGPALLLRVAWPPPHLPTSAAYWMGTPAALNASWPATTLRLLDRPVTGGPLPDSWQRGNHPAGLTISARHRLASLGVALAVLGLGGGALLWAYGAGALGDARRAWRHLPRPLRARQALEATITGECRIETTTGSPETPRPHPGVERDLLLLGSTVSLVLLAAPISWYHYQIFQLLPVSVLAARLLRRRAVLPLLLLAGLLAAVTRLPAWGFGLYVERFGWEAGSPALLWLATTSGPILGTALFALLVVELRRAHPASLRRRG